MYNVFKMTDRHQPLAGESPEVTTINLGSPASMSDGAQLPMTAFQAATAVPLEAMAVPQAVPVPQEVAAALQADPLPQPVTAAPEEVSAPQEAAAALKGKRAPRASKPRKPRKASKAKGAKEDTSTSESADAVQRLYKLLLQYVVKVNSYYQVDLRMWAAGTPQEAQMAARWRRHTLPELRSNLRDIGYSPKTITSALTMLMRDSEAKVVSRKHYREGLPLRPAGYQMIGGKSWFLEEDSYPITPAKEGDPSPVVRACCRLLGMDTPIFLGWLKGCLESQLAYAAALRGQESEYRQRASQTLCVVGPPNTGKTNVLIKLIVEGVLGPSSSIPAGWLSERSQFGEFMLTSPLWVADDVPAFSRAEDRKKGANRLKGAGYAGKNSVEEKHKSALDTQYPSARIILCNDDELSMRRSLIDFTETPDKVLVLHNCWDAGFLADYGGDLDKMDTSIKEAIPAFANWLLNKYQLPEWTTRTDKTPRHMVMDGGYVSPVVYQMMAEIDDVGILMQHLVKVYNRHQDMQDAWVSQAQILEAINQDVAKDFSPTTNMMGRTLGQCCRRWSSLLESKRTSAGTRYCMRKRPEWEDALMGTMPQRVAQMDTNLLQAAGLMQNVEYMSMLSGYISEIDKSQAQ